jgi:hypothetical protein
VPGKGNLGQAAIGRAIPGKAFVENHARLTDPERRALLNALLARMLPLLEPTHTDPILRRFPNYNEVWARE